MKITIDGEECIGCGSCVELCPDVFQMQADEEKAIGRRNNLIVPYSKFLCDRINRHKPTPR
jgi:ferredoxin